MTSVNSHKRLIVMGVTASGKSTIGAALANRLGAAFLDGDDFHPEANVRKMASGQPLTDDDRWPWLDRLGAAMDDRVAKSGKAVLACSALRLVYRKRLARAVAGPITFIHLAGSPDLLSRRMGERQDHFMPVGLLDSQLATLEPLTAEERGLTVPIDQSVEQTIAQILERLSPR